MEKENSSFETPGSIIRISQGFWVLDPKGYIQELREELGRVRFDLVEVGKRFVDLGGLALNANTNLNTLKLCFYYSKFIKNQKHYYF